MHYGKYAHVLSILATIPTPPLIDKKTTWGSYRMRCWEGVATPEVATQAMDHILEYMHEHFVPPTTNRESPEWTKNLEEMRHILTKGGLNDEFLKFLETLPPYYSEVGFPVAVIRYMLRDLMMPINHRLSTQFKTFHQRYGALILADY